MSNSNEVALGNEPELAGDVTVLKAIMPGAERETEKMLGYHEGRLADGYWVAVLKQSLTPADFQFGGITLRSGGKLGLPAQTWAEDGNRVLVHKQMQDEYGQGGYVGMQQAALRKIGRIGPMRIAKVLPFARHDNAIGPAVQYPPGGGALQWKLVRKCKFLIALEVDANGNARTPKFSVPLGGGYLAGLEARTRIRKYLEVAWD